MADPMEEKRSWDDSGPGDLDRRPSPNSGPSSPSGLGRVAGQVAQWTTRGLLAAVILAASVGFGRQVLLWWRQEPPGQANFVDPLAGLGEPDRVHVVRFGQYPWKFHRVMISGDISSAVERLKSECIRATAQCQTRQLPSGDQEKQFLERLKGRSPVAEGPGWAVYAFHEGVPLVVGVRKAVPPPSENPSGAPPSGLSKKEPILFLPHWPPGETPSLEKTNQPRGGETPPREGNPRPQREQKESPIPAKPVPAGEDVALDTTSVVSWGFGLPYGPGQWTLWILVADASGPGGASSTDLIPLPPEGSLICSFEVLQGGGLLLFRGPPRPETWKRFYENHFQAQGGRQVGPWLYEAGRWQGRFSWPATSPNTPEEKPSGERTVEIYFGPTPSGDWTGLLWIWANSIPSGESPESNP